MSSLGCACFKYVNLKFLSGSYNNINRNNVMGSSTSNNTRPLYSDIITTLAGLWTAFITWRLHNKVPTIRLAFSKQCSTKITKKCPHSWLFGLEKVHSFLYSLVAILEEEFCCLHEILSSHSSVDHNCYWSLHHCNKDSTLNHLEFLEILKFSVSIISSLFPFTATKHN